MEGSDTYDFEEIEKYINGELEGGTLKDFEQRMQVDPDFAEQVETVRQLPSALYQIEKDQLSDQVKRWMKSEESSPAKPDRKKVASIITMRRIMRVAIMLIVVVGAVSIWYFSESEDLNQLSATYLAQHFQDPVVLRGSLDEAWEEAIESYVADDFESMIEQMTPIIEEGSPTAEQHFYYALAHLYAEPADDDKALVHFKKTEQMDGETYAEDIAWYRALIYVRRGEMEEGRNQLQKVAESNRYKHDAQDLLEKLNKKIK